MQLPSYKDVLRRLDQLVRDADELLENKIVCESTSTKEEKSYVVESAKFTGFRASSLHFIREMVGGEHSEYYKSFSSNCNIASPYYVKNAKALLLEVKKELEYRWQWTNRGIANAELYTDFLEMAADLLQSGLKDPSAVICGSVLEEHLRNLCRKHSVPTTEDRNGKPVPRKADALNSALANVAYNKLDQKWVTNALDLRNKAAHGHFSDYTAEQVNILLKGSMDFIQRNPA